MNIQFCKNIRDSRKAKGLTQKQVATLLGMAESSYTNWELGRTEPSITDLHKLCVILDASADYILGLEHEDGSKIEPPYNLTSKDGD